MKKLAKQTKQYSYKEDISHLIDVHTSFQCNNALCFTDFKRQPSARLRASKRRVGAAPSLLRRRCRRPRRGPRRRREYIRNTFS